MKLEVVTRESQAEPERAPLLFVHGSCHASWCWEENFLDYFASRGHSSHALSLRGHGQSEGGDKLRWTSVDDYVRDVASVAERLPSRPVVIGHSLGGLVVQKYLEKHAAPAAVLLAPSPSYGMLVGGFHLFLRHPLLFAKMLLTLDVQTLYGTPALVHKMLFSAGLDKAKVERYAGRFGKESFRAALDMMLCLPRPKRVNSMLLVLGAANDAIVRPRAIEQTGRAYSAEFKIFPGMAHDMMLEDGWQDVAAHIDGWLKAKGL
ncbi:MAG: alpha/beta fold hydrolase [Pyrinomonadaceae bacterium]